MTPNDAAIADVYAAMFAARTDDHVTWVRDHWQRAGAPLTAARVWAAFRGGPSLSGYTIHPDNRTHICCIDFDTPEGLAQARRLRATMDARDVHAYVEPSRRGSHLWVILDRETPAQAVRRGLRAFLRDAGIAEDPKIEIRPSQDEIQPEGYGNPIRLPTMPHPKTGKRYPLLDAADRPLSPRLGEMVLAVEESPAWVFEAMADTLRPTVKDIPAGDRRPYRGPTTDDSASDILRRLWGAENARPNHTIKCPAHRDDHPSLSILPDDKRVCCKSPSCALYNDGRGRGTYELTVMAPKRGER